MTRNVNVIFCDDIRLENNGKFLLIGVYAGEMVVNHVPSAVGISQWISISELGAGDHPFRLRVVLDEEGTKTELGSISGTMNVLDHTLPAVIYPGALLTNVTRNGRLRVYLSLDNEPETEVGSLRISVILTGAT